MTLTEEVKKLCEWNVDWNDTLMRADEFTHKHGFLTGTSPGMLIRKQAEKVLSLLSAEAKGGEVRVFEDTKIGCVQVFGRREGGEFWDSEAGFNGKAVSNLKFILSDQLFGRDRELHGEEKTKWLAAHPLPGEATTKTYRVKRAWRDGGCTNVWISGKFTEYQWDGNTGFEYGGSPVTAFDGNEELTGPELLAVQEQYERENPIIPPTPAQVKPARKFEWVECEASDKCKGKISICVDGQWLEIKPVEIK